MLLYIAPAETEVEALSVTAGQQLHTVGTVQVDPQSIVLVWNFGTGTPLAETSTRSFQRHGCWLFYPKGLCQQCLYMEDDSTATSYFLARLIHGGQSVL